MWQPGKLRRCKVALLSHLVNCESTDLICNPFFSPSVPTGIDSGYQTRVAPEPNRAALLLPGANGDDQGASGLMPPQTVGNYVPAILDLFY